MAKKEASFTLEISDDEIQATFAGRMLTLPTYKGKDEQGAPVLVVEIDAADTWDDGSDLAMEDLVKVLERIELECDARDIQIEFE